MNHITQKQKSAWLVWLIILLFAGMLFMQTRVEGPLPVEGAAFALLFVVGAYVGLDQFATYVTSRKMPSGQKYTGSYRKLLLITLAMIAVLIESLIVQYLSPQASIPLDLLFITVGIVSALFVGGNKANNAAEHDIEKEGG